MSDRKKLEDKTVDELIDYIRNELRPENGQLRESLKGYETAFGRFSDASKKGLLHLVTVFAQDQRAGAELMKELSEDVLGPAPTTEETTVTEDNKTDTDAPADDAPAWAKALMESNAAMAEEIKALKAGRDSDEAADAAAAVETFKSEARGMGFVEGTPEWQEFFRIAASDLVQGDLAVAKNHYTKLVGPVPADAEEGDGKESESEEEGDPAFPKTGGAGGAGAPDSSSSSGEDGLDFSDKGAVNAAALQYMTEAAATNPAAP